MKKRKTFELPDPFDEEDSNEESKQKAKPSNNPFDIFFDQKITAPKNYLLKLNNTINRKGREKKFKKEIDEELLETTSKELEEYILAEKRESIEEDKKLIEECIDELKTFIQKQILKEYTCNWDLQCFGSFSYGLWERGCDVDLNLYTEKEIEGFFQKMQDWLLREHQISSQIVNTARIPLIKFKFKGYSFDVTHQIGSIADHNIKIKSWIQSILKKNECLAPTIKIIKKWSKSKGLNNPQKNSLPSLAYLVMLVCVFEENESEISTYNKKNFYWGCSHLLLSFFKKYTESMTGSMIRTKDGVGTDSIKLFQEISDKQDFNRIGFGNTLFIQDPFLLSINLGRFVTSSSYYQQILPEFKETTEMLFSREEENKGKKLKKILGMIK